MTGLSRGQLTELSARVAAAIGDVVKPGGRGAAAGLYKSVAMVVTLLRTNITQEMSGDIFGCSQATVSRRWDLLRPVIGQVLASCVPDPRQILGGGTALVDGTIAPTWDWAAIPDLFSGKAGYPGMNLQIAATLGGRVAAIGPVLVHGARHDAHAFAASGLKDLLAGLPAAADLGYTGVDGIAIVPYRTPPGGQLHDPRPHSTSSSAPSARMLNAPSPASRPGGSCPKKAAVTVPRSAICRDADSRHRAVLLQQLLQPLMNKLPGLRSSGRTITREIRCPGRRSKGLPDVRARVRGRGWVAGNRL